MRGLGLTPCLGSGVRKKLSTEIIIFIFDGKRIFKGKKLKMKMKGQTFLEDCKIFVVKLKKGK